MSLKSFTAAIDTAIVNTDTKLETLLRRVSVVIAENTIVGGDYSPGTPIDTGFARASWWLCLNGITGGPGGEVGQASLDAVLLAIPQIQVGDLIYLVNNAEYIEALEGGHSDQAPTGFIEITVKNGQLIVDNVVSTLGQ